MKSDSTAARLAFEVWISAPPYEHEVLRYPMDEVNYAWPGQYRNNSVELAWQAWCQSSNTQQGFKKTE